MPLENSGISIDMVTGKPVNRRAEDQRTQAEIRRNQVLSEATAVQREIAGSPILSILYQRYQERIRILAGNDPECRVIEQLAQELRHKYEFAPRLAQDRLDQILGEDLKRFHQVRPERDSGPTI